MFNSAVSSPDAAHATHNAQAIPPAYRAEYNVLSGRWMVLDGNNVCQRAGLSQHGANTVVRELMQH